MSRRSQVIQQRRALEASKQGLPAVPSFPNKQRETPAMQVGVSGLVPLLMNQGAKLGYKVLSADDAKIVRFVATCGPVEIPLDFPVLEARKLIDTLNQAVDKVDPVEAEESPIQVSPEAEALLQECIVAAECRDGTAVKCICCQ
jgi:hypothetical protein